jgi:hypothetical protein
MKATVESVASHFLRFVGNRVVVLSTLTCNCFYSIEWNSCVIVRNDEDPWTVYVLHYYHSSRHSFDCASFSSQHDDLSGLPLKASHIHTPDDDSQYSLEPSLYGPASKRNLGSVNQLVIPRSFSSRWRLSNSSS